MIKHYLLIIFREILPFNLFIKLVKKYISPLSKKLYLQWVKEDNKRDIDKAIKINKELLLLESTPLISIVIPTYNSNPKWLIEAIESVKNQIYSNWQLCISDDFSSDKQLLEILKKEERLSNKINIFFREYNGHISENSNSALKLVKGEWVALLDHDDLIREDALVWIAKGIIDNPEVLLIYSDEDKLDSNNQRTQPYFKPDFNLELLLGQNFFSHFGIYNKNLLDEIGGFRLGYEGSQDYDLVLRCVNKISNNKQILHINKVLYHWRMHELSASFNKDAKSYAPIAAKNAIQDYLHKKGEDIDVEILNHGYRVISKKNPLKNLLLIVELKGESVVKITNSLNVVFHGLGKDKKLDILFFYKSFNKKKIKQLERLLRNKSNIEFIKLKKSGIYQYLGNALPNRDVNFMMFWDLSIIDIVNERGDESYWIKDLASSLKEKDTVAASPKIITKKHRIFFSGIYIGFGNIPQCINFNQHSSNNGYFGRANLIQEFSLLSNMVILIKTKNFLEVINKFKKTKDEIGFYKIMRILKEHNYRFIYNPFSVLISNKNYLQRKLFKIKFAFESFGFLKNNNKKGSTEIFKDPFINKNIILLNSKEYLKKIT